MRVLWDHGPRSWPKSARAQTDDLAYTTVLTILRTLETKGVCSSHQEEGRVHRYFAAVKEPAAQRSALATPHAEIVQRLRRCYSLFTWCRIQKLSPEQIRRMRKLLTEKSDKEES